VTCISVLSCFPPSLPLSRIPRAHMCIGSESRLSLREGSTAQAAMTSLCYDSCEFHWNERRQRPTHVNKVKETELRLEGELELTSPPFPRRIRTNFTNIHKDFLHCHQHSQGLPSLPPTFHTHYLSEAGHAVARLVEALR